MIRSIFSLFLITVVCFLLTESAYAFPMSNTSSSSNTMTTTTSPLRWTPTSLSPTFTTSPLRWTPTSLSPTFTTSPLRWTPTSLSPTFTTSPLRWTPTSLSPTFTTSPLRWTPTSLSPTFTTSPLRWTPTSLSPTSTTSLSFTSPTPTESLVFSRSHTRSMTRSSESKTDTVTPPRTPTSSLSHSFLSGTTSFTSISKTPSDVLSPSSSQSRSLAASSTTSNIITPSHSVSAPSLSLSRTVSQIPTHSHTDTSSMSRSISMSQTKTKSRCSRSRSPSSSISFTHSHKVSRSRSSLSLSRSVFSPTGSSSLSFARTASPTQSRSAPSKSISLTKGSRSRTASMTGVPTLSPVPTPSLSQTRTKLPTRTDSLTRTVTPPATLTPPPTPTPPLTLSSSDSLSRSLTNTSTPPPTLTLTFTPSFSSSESLTWTRTPPPTKTQSPTQSPTLTFSHTLTDTITPPPTPTTPLTASATWGNGSATWPLTPTYTSPSTTRSQTNSLLPTATRTLVPTATLTLSFTSVASFSLSISDSLSTDPTLSSTTTQSVTPSDTSTRSDTASRSFSSNSSATASLSISLTLSVNATSTYSLSLSLTSSQTTIPSLSESVSLTFTNSKSLSVSHSLVPTLSLSSSLSASGTSTQSRTTTKTSSSSLSFSIPPTMTHNPTPTLSMAPSATVSQTESLSSSPTLFPTSTETMPQTETGTYSQTFTASPPTPPMTPSLTLTGSFSLALTLSLTASRTFSSTQTNLLTSSDTLPATITATATVSSSTTFTQTLIPTHTFSMTASNTYSKTVPTRTGTETLVLTESSSVSFSSSFSFSESSSTTSSFSQTRSSPLSLTLSLLPTATVSISFTSTVSESTSSSLSFSLSSTSTRTRSSTGSSSLTQTDTITPPPTPTPTESISQSAPERPNFLPSPCDDFPSYPYAYTLGSWPMGMRATSLSGTAAYLLAGVFDLVSCQAECERLHAVGQTVGGCIGFEYRSSARECILFGPADTNPNAWLEGLTSFSKLFEFPFSTSVAPSSFLNDDSANTGTLSPLLHSFIDLPHCLRCSEGRAEVTCDTCVGFGYCATIVENTGVGDSRKGAIVSLTPFAVSLAQNSSFKECSAACAGAPGCVGIELIPHIVNKTTLHFVRCNLFLKKKVDIGNKLLHPQNGMKYTSLFPSTVLPIQSEFYEVGRNMGRYLKKETANVQVILKQTPAPLEDFSSHHWFSQRRFSMKFLLMPTAGRRVSVIYSALPDEKKEAKGDDDDDDDVSKSKIVIQIFGGARPAEVSLSSRSITTSTSNGGSSTRNTEAFYVGSTFVQTADDLFSVCNLLKTVAFVNASSSSSTNKDFTVEVSSRSNSVIDVTFAESTKHICGGVVEGYIHSTRPLSKVLFFSLLAGSTDSLFSDVASSSDLALPLYKKSALWIHDSPQYLYAIPNEIDPAFLRSFVEKNLQQRASSSLIQSDITFVRKCSVPDLGSYEVLSQVPSSGSLFRCQEFDTVSGIHSACNSLDFCDGFVTEVTHSMEDAGASEHPLCLVMGSGSRAQTFSSEEHVTGKRLRYFYRRPLASEYVCTSRGEQLLSNESDSSVAKKPEMVEVDVLLLQSSFDISSVQVLRGSRVVATCGLSSPFRDGKLGLRGQCNLYLSCYKTKLLSNETLTVQPLQRSIYAADCEAALGVLFVYSIKNSSTSDTGNTTQTAGTSTSASQDIISFLEGRNTGVPLNTVARFSRKVQLHLGTSPLSDGWFRAVVYVQNAVAMQMRVAQTVFSCDAANKNGQCSSQYDIQLSIRTNNNNSNSQQSSLKAVCGGSTGFEDGPGLSGQCFTMLSCPALSLLGNSTFMLQPTVMKREEFTPWNESSLFSGALEIRVNSSIFSRAGSSPILTKGCSAPFSAELFVWIPTVKGDINQQQQQNRSIQDAFPLLKGENSYGHFLAFNAKKMSKEIIITSGNQSAPVLQIPSINFTIPSELPMISGPSFQAIPPQAETVNVNSKNDEALLFLSSYVCVIDFVDSAYALCTVEIPVSANYVAVRVAQSDFAFETVTLSHRVTYPEMGEYENITTLARCGGSSRFPFGTDVGLTGQCGLFASCYEGALLRKSIRVASTGESNSYSSGEKSIEEIALQVSSNLRVMTCKAAVTAVISFYFNPALDSVANATAPSTCPEERRCLHRADNRWNCLSIEDICNRKIDCRNSQDESFCTNWHLLSSETILLSPQILITESNIFSKELCMRIAASRASDGFSWGNQSGECVVYATNFIHEKVFASLSSYVLQFTSALSAQGYRPMEFHVRVDNLDDIKECNDIIHCRGHGEASSYVAPWGVPASTQSIPSSLTRRCSCACHTGFTGAHCEVAVAPSLTPSLVLVLSAGTTSSSSSGLLSGEEKSSLASTLDPQKISNAILKAVLPFCFSFAGIEALEVQSYPVIEITEDNKNNPASTTSTVLLLGVPFELIVSYGSSSYSFFSLPQEIRRRKEIEQQLNMRLIGSSGNGNERSSVLSTIQSLLASEYPFSEILFAKEVKPMWNLVKHADISASCVRILSPISSSLQCESDDTVEGISSFLTDDSSTRLRGVRTTVPRLLFSSSTAMQLSGVARVERNTESLGFSSSLSPPRVSAQRRAEEDRASVAQKGKQRRVQHPLSNTGSSSPSMDSTKFFYSSPPCVYLRTAYRDGCEVLTCAFPDTSFVLSNNLPTLSADVVNNEGKEEDRSGDFYVSQVQSLELAPTTASGVGTRTENNADESSIASDTGSTASGRAQCVRAPKVELEFQHVFSPVLLGSASAGTSTKRKALFYVAVVSSVVCALCWMGGIVMWIRFSSRQSP